MENFDQNDAANAAAQQQTNADASQTQSPLPTYESINASAPVVTADVIEERRKQAAASRGSSENAPLGAIRDANKRRRENAKEGQEEGGEKGAKRPPRERRERSERVAPVVPKRPVSNAVLPNRREGLSSDLEDEFQALMDGQSLDSMMKIGDAVANETIEDGSKVSCRVDSIAGESVFVNLGAREQGLIPLKQFPDDMHLEVGQQFDAVVTKFNSAEGYYEVSLPLAAAEVGDWLSLTKGAIVEARVTGSNKGGLEVEVGRLRGFMPASQIAPFFVENAEQFVGEHWKCVITEVNAERRNLVVSRRQLMELERKEQAEKVWAELAVGQSREGSIRNIIPVGAFVDLGGVDGFIPIGEMSWNRIKTPEDVVKIGDCVTVTVLRIDQAKKRIALSLKDSAQDPWNAPTYREGEVVRGRVTKIMDFGAFVELTPGIEGLVHISEIAYKRVDKVSDVLNADDFVDVKILSIDQDKKKISLSIKQTQQDPREVARKEAQEKADAEAAAAEEDARKKDEEALAASRERIRKLQPKKPLKGGLGRKDDSDKFGLHF